VKKTEISKLEAYLRRTFGNDDIQLKAPPGADDPARMMIGTDAVAEIWRDEDEGELSWSLEATLDNASVKELEGNLRELFFSRDLVVKPRPRKDDSVEIHIGDEFIGIAFREEEGGDRIWKFNMAILELDVEGA